MIRLLKHSGTHARVVLACIALAALAGCGEAPAPAAQGAAQATSAPGAPAAAQEVAGTPGPTTAETAAAAQSTAVALAAAGSASRSAAAMVTYRTRVGIALQSYANALGALRERDRQLTARPALISDAEWQLRATTALRQMDVALSQINAVTPIPPEMTATDGLIRQIERESRVLAQEYARGMQGGSPTATTTAGSRTTSMLSLLNQANLELRRGAA